MKCSRKITSLMIIGCIAVGYFIGSYAGHGKVIKQLSVAQGWDKLDVIQKEHIASNALAYINWKDVNVDIARKTLTDVLDVANIPHGDLAVPSLVAHSGRYVISQWQRSAVGSTVMVLGTDKDGDLCVALGSQRGTMRHPQGYMEVALPKDDLTGLREKHASRINAKTSIPVPADDKLEANAVREVYEEVGLHVTQEQLKLLSIYTDMDASPVTIAANYMVTLHDTPDLETKDEEFVSDDLAKPIWVKVKDITKNAEKNQYFTSANSLSLPMDEKTVTILNEALEALKHPCL